MTPGSIVALTSCKAWRQDDNTETTVSGLWLVEERIFPDRSCGQFEAGFILVAADSACCEDDDAVFIELDTLREQVNPRSHGRMLYQNRRQELAAEYDPSY